MKFVDEAFIDIAAGDGGDSRFQSAVEGRLQFEDKDNPRRLQAELIYRRIDPVGAGSYQMDEPRAWIYLEDGRALFVRADSGRVKIPDRTKSPESGYFDGNVVALLFPARTAEQEFLPRDPMTDAPTLVARTTAARFDAQTLVFASDDLVTIDTADVRFAGTGVEVRGNQVLDRIEYLKVVKDGVIRYRARQRDAGEPDPAQQPEIAAADGAEPVDAIAIPTDGDDYEIAAAFDDRAFLAQVEAEESRRLAIAESEPAPEGSNQPDLAAAPTTPEPGEPTETVAADASDDTATGGPMPISPAAAVAAARAAAQAPPPKEDLYEAVFANKVRVTQQRREIASDMLFVWFRTLDNKLPADTFGDNADSLAARTPASSPKRERPRARRNAPVSHHLGLPPIAAIPALALAAQAEATDAAPQPDATSGQPDAESAPAAPAPNAAAQQWPSKLFIDGDDDIELTWDGPLAVNPIAVSPPPRELDRGNHLTLRFTSRAPGANSFVRLSDAEIGARGGCDELEYFATLRDMTLSSGGDSPQVWLAAPEAGCLAGKTIHVNLGTGVADIPSAGMLGTLTEDLNHTAMTENDRGLPNWLVQVRPEFFSRIIDWDRAANFQFRSRDNQIRDALEWAEFHGRAFATDNAASLAGDLIRADFVEHGEQTTVLRKLLVEGDVEALARGWRRPEGVEVSLSAGNLGDGVLRGDRVEVSFKPSRDGEAEPTYLIAHGDGIGAIVGKDDATLAAPKLEASMTRDTNGEIIVTDFEALGDGDRLARFDRGDGVWAAGRRIRGHAQRQLASVTGPDVQVASRASVITSTIVELNGLAETMDVFAPGRFTHEQPAESGDGTTRIAANWSDWMTFDNVSGILECRGEARVIRDEPLLRDTVNAERIRVELSSENGETNAVAEVPTNGASGGGIESELGDRRFLRATAYGSIEDRVDGKPATVESRAYAAPTQPGADRTLETISYIEAPRLIADDVEGTVRAPTAGRAVVYDQRSPDASQEEQDADAPLVTSHRGTSSFRWAKSMVFTRDTGILDLFEKIEVVHKPLDNRPLTRMTSDRLQAKLDMTPRSGAQSDGGKLIYAEATGSVYTESGPQRLVGEKVLYDARAGTAVATAGPGGTVTLFDDRRAAPFTARRLKWDLVKDEIQILEPATITAPR